MPVCVTRRMLLSSTACRSPDRASACPGAFGRQPPRGGAVLRGARGSRRGDRRGGEGLEEAAIDERHLRPLSTGRPRAT
jgi:hypothetical protein